MEKAFKTGAGEDTFGIIMVLENLNQERKPEKESCFNHEI